LLYKLSIEETAFREVTTTATREEELAKKTVELCQYPSFIDPGVAATS